MRVRTDPDSRLSEQELRRTVRVCVMAGLISMGLALSLVAWPLSLAFNNGSFDIPYTRKVVPPPSLRFNKNGKNYSDVRRTPREMLLNPFSLTLAGVPLVLSVFFFGRALRLRGRYQARMREMNG